MTRRELIEHLLEHYDDFFIPGSTGREGPGDGYGSPGMPKTMFAGKVISMTDHPTVKELVRCLDRHRDVAPVQHAHMMMFYRCEWRTVRGKRKYRMVRGKKVLVPVTPKDLRLDRVLPRWVDKGKVRKGVDFLDKMWDRSVHLVLPAVLEKAA